jgi:uncharacterized protein YbjQ (UPF0145 family)
MGFFGRDNNADTGIGDRLKSGYVPAEADARLSGLGADLFSSTLSVNEFALLTEMGPQPLAQVLGASVHQVGWQYLPPQAQWGGSDLFCQMYTVSQAWAEARRNAFARLREEARQVGADAVVGVQLRRGTHDWARNSVDFVVNGTAIRLPGTPSPSDATVALSDLSAQDYWKLVGGGWGPAGLVATTTVFFMSQGSWTRWRRRTSAMKNQELYEFSEAFSAARRAAMSDLRGQAESVKADGIVGVSLQYEINRGKFGVAVPTGPSGLGAGTMSIGGGQMVRMGGTDSRKGIVITMHAVGTAIRRQHAAQRETPRQIVSLGGAL